MIGTFPTRRWRSTSRRPTRWLRPIGSKRAAASRNWPTPSSLPVITVPTVRRGASSSRQANWIRRALSRLQTAVIDFFQACRCCDGYRQFAAVRSEESIRKRRSIRRGELLAGHDQNVQPADQRSIPADETSMKIVFVIPMGIDRPSGQRYFNIAKGLVAQGHDRAHPRAASGSRTLSAAALRAGRRGSLVYGPDARQKARHIAGSLFAAATAARGSGFDAGLGARHSGIAGRCLSSGQTAADQRPGGVDRHQSAAQTGLLRRLRRR